MFAAVGAIKSLFYSQMRLNRISGGQTESVNGCERLANNLIDSKIVNATIQISMPNNIKTKKEHRRCGGDVVFEEYLYLLSIDTTNIAMLIVNCQLLQT